MPSIALARPRPSQFRQDRRGHRFATFVATVLLGGLAVLSTSGADWPRWRGPANDGHADASEEPLLSLPTDPAPVWQVPAGEGLASPVVSRGRVFAFDNQGGKETLRALSVDNGRELWRAEVDVPFSDSQGPTGPRNTPVVDDDRVFAVSCRGELQCRNVDDGSLLWRTSFVKDHQAVFIGESGTAPGATRHGNNGSPLVDGDHLIALVGGTNGAGVVCFAKRTGGLIWKSTSDQAAYAPPVVATIAGERQILCFNVAGLVGLRRSDGKELWRVPIKTAFARHVTAPVVLENTIVVSSHQVGLLGIRVTRDGDVWSASTAWTSKEAAMNYASPVAVGESLYGLGPKKNLVCVDIRTGQIRWSKDSVFVSPADKAYGGFVVVKDRILALTDSGELILFSADPASYREHSRVQVTGSNWANPALSDGVVYLRDGLKQTGQWRAFRLKAEPH